jgi:hypothetical protein
MHRRDFLLTAMGTAPLAVGTGPLAVPRGVEAAATEADGRAFSVAGAVSAATIDALRRLPPRTGALAFVRGYWTADDGGGGLFRWDDAATAADDGGVSIQPEGSGRRGERGRWLRIIDSPFVNARWFGARGDGVGDDAAALQAAIDHCQAGRSTVLFIPAGAYRLVGRRGADRLRNGIVVRHHPPILNGAQAVRILGAGRATRLVAGADGMVLVRCSADASTIGALTLDAGGRAGIWGLAVVPEDMGQTTAVVSQQYNVLENILISGCQEAIVQQPGPSVNRVASGSFYNRYDSIHVYGCGRGVWLRPGATNDIGNNRNLFTNLVMTNGCNTGVHIEAGDTNTFVACHFEGVAAGASPSAPPTAVRIAARSGRVDNNSNTFISCKFEACTRDVDNESGYSEFYGCAYNIGGGKTNFAALPMVSLGGYDPSNTPLIYGGLVLQHNDIAKGFPLGCLALDNRLIAGIFDRDGKTRAYPITVAETENIAGIVAAESEYWKLNGVVEWHLRLAFVGTGRPGGVKLALPLAPNLALHRKRAPAPPSRFPVAVTSGLPRPDGSEAMVLARCSDEAQSLAGRAFLAIPPPPGAEAFSASPANHVSLCIRYRA